MDVTETIRVPAAAVPPGGDGTDRAENERGALPTGILDRMQPPTPEPPMVGRRDELAGLAAALRRAGDGTAALLVLTGEGGIGKTRLLQAAAAEAHSEGIPVLVGGSAPYPYAPLVGILREVRRSLGDPRLQRMLTGARRPLVRLVPGLEPGSASEAPVAAQAPLFEAVLDLVAELGRNTPVLLGMEDLHQADESTLALVRFLAANMTTERAVFVATCRTDGARSRRVGSFLAEVVRHPAARRFDIAPLSDAEVTQLLTEIQQGRPPEETAVRIARRSQGNPFYVEELLAAGPGDDDLPHGLEELLVARLAGLSPETREVLRAASALGDRPHDRLLRAITDLPDAELRAGLQEAADHGLLVPEGDLSERYRFRHDLIREVVHRRLLVDQRRRFHAAAARALEAEPGLAAGGSDQVNAELARHWHLAGEPDRAFTASLVASEEAKGVHALSEALAHLQRALDLWDQVSEDVRSQAGLRHELEMRCAGLATPCGDPTGGLRHTESALSDPDVPAEVQALLHAQASGFLRTLARAGEARSRIDRALDILPTHPSPERAETLALAAGQRMFAGGDLHGGLELATEALGAAEEADHRRVEALARNYRGCILQALGRGEEGIGDLREALSISLEAGNDVEVKRAYINLSEMLLREGRFDEAVDVAERALDWASGHGIGPSNEEGMLLNAVDGLISAGRWGEAQDRLSDVRSVSRSAVTTDVVEAFVAATLHIRRGDLATARRLLDRVPAEAIDGLNPELEGPYLSALAELALADGRHDRVHELAIRARRIGEHLFDQQGIASFDAVGCLDPTLCHGIRSEVETALADGPDTVGAALDHARDLVATLRDAAERAPVGTHVRDRLVASLALGEAELTRLGDEPEPDTWRAAVSASVATGIPYREAYARFRLAEALLECGDRDGATEALAAADAIAERLGAAPLRQEIATLARRGRLGLEVAHRDEQLGSDLTSREHDVLELLVEGRTNRQIGEDLYIAEKTVERHVTSILDKLQVDNRTEAAAVARKRQLVHAG